ncbi:carotene biosynthesis-related protein CBR, chloroplastic [Dunaliella salina]|uniref:Carotene biosynthesis-related protein CBR, chloroplastic n=1 Tax=Dunaliella salina TaxID=3046 RepID=A0ABQ7GDN1_DUNSA|nr:carotene biosynthesis-related protein CBR, chloroplastic [Dunaliella salina]|eukprot:KAF5832722.1 carotene biosynthesis-related protein CBR, chloroplastic [Dunaliella salina]
MQLHMNLPTSRIAAGASFNVRPAPLLRTAAPKRACKHIMRAENEPSTPPPPRASQESPSSSPSPPPPPPPPAAPTVTEVMGFSGAPEIINGRLAMLGFVAALGAELSTGESVVTQLGDEPTLIALTFVLFSAASLIPAFARRQGDTVGPFTPQAEMTNGRFAMIGFAAMLIYEGVQGAALF